MDFYNLLGDCQDDLMICIHPSNLVRGHSDDQEIFHECMFRLRPGHIDPCEKYILFEGEEGGDFDVNMNLFDQHHPCMPNLPAKIKDSNSVLSPLQVATSSGNKGIVRALLMIGADPNIGYPLLPARLQHWSMTKLLLDAGADPNIKLPNFGSPLIGQFNPTIVRLLVEAGTDLNYRSEKHGTAIEFAVENGKIEIVELLKSYGAIG